MMFSCERMQPLLIEGITSSTLQMPHHLPRRSLCARYHEMHIDQAEVRRRKHGNLVGYRHGGSFGRRHRA